MRDLIAGEGGSVLVAAASSTSAVALACEGLGESCTTPSGLTVLDTAAIPDDLDVDRILLTPCEPVTRAIVEQWALARGVPVETYEATALRPPSGVRVVAVSAVSTGSGKTALTRRVARLLHRSGVSVCVVRHPIASLLHWKRFAPSIVRAPAQLSAPGPIDEREEIAPIVGTGARVVTGLDPDGLLQAASREAGDGGVVVWDGGGAAEPWITSDLHLVALDLLRLPPDGASERVASADAVVLTKADSAPADRARELESAVRSWNPEAAVLLADLAVGVQPGQALADRAAVVIEDAASLMLGGLTGGAGAVAARRFRCGVVDPRRFAVGAIAAALRSNGHLKGVIPSLGRTPAEIDDLAATVAATPGEVVLWASNADPAFVIPDEKRPIVRAYGELTEVAGTPLHEIVASLLPGA